MAERLADASESLIYFFTVLTNTETRINLLDSLEYKRNWTEWAFDWAVGERNAINKDRMFRNLILLKRYVDDVIKVHGKITNALDRVKGLHMRSKQLSLLTTGIADLCVDDKSQISFIMRLNSKFLENTELLPEKFKYYEGKVVEGVAGVAGVIALGAAGAAVKVAVVKGFVVSPLMIKISTGTLGLALGGIVIVGG